jgi:hypothetical protein
MRVRGGTLGLLAAIDAGRVDPLDASTPVDPPREPKLSRRDWQRIERRIADEARSRSSCMIPRRS